jgi:hypothetical protein
MCAVSIQRKFPQDAGEEESRTSSRTPVNLERKLKEDKSMPRKRKQAEGVYASVPQVLNAW